MQLSIRNMLGKLRRHPRTRSELLSVLLIAIVFVVAYAYWPLANPPTTVTAASSGAPVSGLPQVQQVPFAVARYGDLGEGAWPQASVPQARQVQHNGDAGEASWPPVAVSQPSFQQVQHNKGADEDESSGPQAAVSQPSAQQVQRQEALKDAWLDRRAGTVSAASNDNVVDQQDALKEKLMIEHGLISSAAIGGGQRQEELKDQWLERRGLTGTGAPSTEADCNASCLNVRQMQIEDMSEDLRYR